MALTHPYRQHNYMGEFTNVAGTDAIVLAAIQARKWDSTGDGLGTPRAGMIYFDTTNSVMKVYDGVSWTVTANDALYPLLTGVRPFTGTQAGVTPVADADLATKGYVDGMVRGLDWQQSVLDKTTTVPGAPSVGDRYLIDDVDSEAIVAVTTGSKMFEIVGDMTAVIVSGDIIRVNGSTANDRWYTVSTCTFNTPNTEIVVTEVVPDATVDGNIYWGATGTAWVTQAGSGPGKIAQCASTGPTVWSYTPALSTKASIDLWRGAATWVENESVVYVFNTAWFLFSSVVNHNNLSGLDGGTTNQYYHLTSAQHTGLTGGGSTTLHDHDGRYYTETELGSITSGSEGASLIGTDSKTNLGASTNVEGCLTDLNTKNPPGVYTNAGNPNAVVNGRVGDICKDTSNDIMYICLTAGTPSSGWVVQ